jgi:cation diffusion facilitator CzcD-associated flavoprotein CzcO
MVRARTPKAQPAIAIIGAGLGGIGAAVTLQSQGYTNIRIFDRQDRAGGAWVVNDYPGAEVDTPSEMYRFSFAPRNWSRSHARRDELLTYVDEVIDRFGLQSYITYGVEVIEARWLDDECRYRLQLSDGSVHVADFVVSAVGMFSSPKIPDWAENPTFEGPIFHTTEWNHDFDIAGKTVAVVGTGSTSATVVPTITPSVEKVYLYQRDPGWVIPKPIVVYPDDHRLSPREHDAKRRKDIWEMHRLVGGSKVLREGSRPNRKMQEIAERLLDESFKDHPELKAAVRPNHPAMGKRAIVSSEFYPALADPRVELIRSAVTGLTRHGVIDSEGVERRADAVVLATGFRAAEFLATLNVFGAGGVSLHETWGGDPSAFLGLCVPGFPNFFIIYGPNTNGAGALLYTEEVQMRFIARAIDAVVRRGGKVTEVSRRLNDRYQRWLQKALDTTVYDTTTNYYKGESGRIVTNWPRSFFLYEALGWALRPFAMRIR